MKISNLCSFTLAAFLGMSLAQGGAADQIKTDKGVVEGTVLPSGIRIFRGIPFAAPPVGDLRWKAPQPVKAWTGVRPAVEFGNNCMQRPIYGNMGFRGKGMSEDCLYLNVWTPAKAATENLPVLVYLFGGGMNAGDGSEPRYDGEALAKKGIVAVTVNYRVTVFGLLSHPELTAEAPYHSSGNYNFLDQNAALKWVQANIAAFGGDPKHVTLAGESAGSSSTSTQLISPLSKGLISAAILESGSAVGATPPPTMAEGEKKGLEFMKAAGAASMKELRAMPADKLLELTAKPEFASFPRVADNYVIPNKDLVALVDAGEQSRVPLLWGSNSEERAAELLLEKNPPTPEGYTAAVKNLFGADASRILAVYPPGKTQDEILDLSMRLASDHGMAYNMWRLSESHRQSSGKPVYRYFFERPRLRFLGAANQQPGRAGGIVTTAAPTPRPPSRGAVHSAEIEYALGNLATNTRFDWKPEDYKISELMNTYFANFIKTYNPNGAGMPEWPAYSPKDNFQVMHLNVVSKAQPETRDRFLALDEVLRKNKKK